MNAPARIFDDRPAVRERTPILVGLVGPSGSGKTFSALRLAAGFQRVTGGETYVIDTEARRALHYAELFKFRHVAFGAPFSPLDYLAAIEHCVAKGATTIVIDSMSHEHEGPGGVLEMHQQAVDRMSGGDRQKAERVKLIAWAAPKQARRRLINTVLQMPCNFILCFRAKEKIKPVPGKEPEHLGFMPIAGEEFVYEMTLKCLLLPGANGIPIWQSSFVGEKAMIKLPEQFRETFSAKPAPQLTEDLGQKLATWAAGASAAPRMTAAEIAAALAACSDPATLRQLESSTRLVWGELGKDDKATIKAAVDEAKARVEQSTAAKPE